MKHTRKTSLRCSATAITFLAVSIMTAALPQQYTYAEENTTGDVLSEIGQDETSEVTTDEVTTDEVVTTTQPETTTQKKNQKVTLAVPQLQFGTKNNKRIITWQRVKKADGYRIYERPSTSKKYTKILVTKKNRLSLWRFKKNTLYNVKVRAFKRVGKKTYYSKFQKKPITFLTKTSSPKLTSPSAGTLVISWDSIKKAEQYVIQYGTDKTFETDCKTLSYKKGTTQVTLYNLAQGKTYYARVLYSRTVGKTYTSPWSSSGKVKVTDASSIINSGYSDTNNFFKDSVFIGDSVMLGFSNYMKRHPEGYLDGAKVYGIGSYSLIHATNPSSALHPMFRGQKMAPEYLVKQLGAKKVFLFFGINDVCTGNGLEGACSNYRLLINNIKRVNPGIEIYVISSTYTLKGSRSYETFHYRLHALNDYMRDYCATNGYNYIDIASYLSDSNGDLKPEYCSDGFLHETWSAYEVWDKVLRSYAVNSK